MEHVGAIYAEGRGRITDLVGDAGEEGASTPVPTCPDWTVHDVVAHLVGACADILAGNIEGVATEAWTAAQVEARRGASLVDLLDEWDDVGPQVEALAGAFPGRAGEQWITDQTTHEHDIRGALGRPGARDSAAADLALGFVVDVGLDRSLGARGLGPVEVVAGDDRWVVGSATPTGDDPSLRFVGDIEAPRHHRPPSEPVAVLKVTPFELFRALTGRRSARQIASFDWSIEPRGYVEAFAYGPFTLSPVDIVE